MSAVIQGPAAAGTLTGLARALVQQGKLRPDRAENYARKALQSNTQFIDAMWDPIGKTVEAIWTGASEPEQAVQDGAALFEEKAQDLR